MQNARKASGQSRVSKKKGREENNKINSSPPPRERWRIWGSVAISTVLVLGISFSLRSNQPSLPIPNLDGTSAGYIPSPSLAANSTFEQNNAYYHFIDEPSDLTDILWTDRKGEVDNDGKKHYLFIDITPAFGITEPTNPLDLLFGRDKFEPCFNNDNRINDLWFYVYEGDETSGNLHDANYGISPCAAWAGLFPQYASTFDDMPLVETGDRIHLFLDPQEHQKFSDRSEMPRITSAIHSAQDVPGRLTHFVSGNKERTYRVGATGKVYTTIYYDWSKGIANFSPGHRPIDENVDRYTEDTTALTGDYPYITFESRNNYGSNRDAYQTTFTFTGVPTNTTAVTAVRVRIAGSLFADLPDTSRVKLVALDGTDLTEWIDFPVLGLSTDVHEIQFSPLLNVPVDRWENMNMVFANQWDSCGATNCAYKQTKIRLYAIDMRFDVECNGECEYIAPSCGNTIEEGYNFEQCDDGNTEDRDHCDNQCINQPDNWWIEDAGIPGPISPFDSQTMKKGQSLVLPSGKVIQTWYSDYMSSSQVYQKLYASVYEPGSGWGTIVHLNDGLAKMSGRDVTILSDADNRIFVFFRTLPGRITGQPPRPDSYRAEFMNGTWETPVEIGTKIDLHTSDIGGDNTGILLYSHLVPISQDLRSDSVFGPILSSYEFDVGLFALPYSNGTWGTSEMLQTLYHTASWQNLVRSNPHANVPSEDAIITGRTGTVYNVEWYDETLEVNIAP